MAIGTPTSASVISRSVVMERFEYRCGVCGYGVVVRDLPEACPMCHGAAWEPSEWRLFTGTSRFTEAERPR
jgi:hypothetical protein